jgi:hypothetical protein
MNNENGMVFSAHTSTPSVIARATAPGVVRGVVHCSVVLDAKEAVAGVEPNMHTTPGGSVSRYTYTNIPLTPAAEQHTAVRTANA